MTLRQPIGKIQLQTEDVWMATPRAALLPWIKRISDDEHSIANFEGRLLFTPLQEAVFVQMLRLERRRSERSGKPFLLVLISGEDFNTKSDCVSVRCAVEAISAGKRETDVLGWYERDVTLGLLMTEIGQGDTGTVETIINKISHLVQQSVGTEKYRRMTLVFRVFPQEGEAISIGNRDCTLYPDLAKRHQEKKHVVPLKRTMDICGSLIGLIVFLPTMLAITLVMKLSSEGPVLFRQKRVGQHGKEFTFYKFRTMYVDNDSRIHHEYVSKLIAGDTASASQANGIYKLIDDPRITPVGRFLRKTSLDELPQFFNVLKDDMSLVGPRPPLPYEYERYQIWHRRRVLELKPGITGLWQVEGRSRTTFDEMVRMDLKYANIRSIWLDLKILMLTPGAMLSGRGAC